jgi:hypothetical protein
MLRVHYNSEIYKILHFNFHQKRSINLDAFVELKKAI